MKNKASFFVFISAISLSSCGNKDFDDSLKLNLKDSFTITDNLSSVDNEIANVVFLFGQSNATGCSETRFLEEKNPEIFSSYSLGYDNVFINYNTENFGHYSDGFVKAKIGQGASDKHFGPEIGIAEILSKHSPTKTFIIKYTYGGTTLHNQWLNGNFERGGLYNCSINFSTSSLEYLISKGYKLNILGICWMQGENDGGLKLHEKYFKNTKKLVDYYREDLSSYKEDIKFVDAYISEVWDNYEDINSAKLKNSTRSSLNYVIDTIELNLKTNQEPERNPDIAHYDSLSMVELGRSFGNYLLK